MIHSNNQRLIQADLGTLLKHIDNNGKLDEAALEIELSTIAYRGGTGTRILLVAGWYEENGKWYHKRPEDCFFPFHVTDGKFDLLNLRDEYFAHLETYLRISRKYNLEVCVDVFDECQMYDWARMPADRKWACWRNNVQGLYHYMDVPVIRYLVAGEDYGYILGYNADDGKHYIYLGGIRFRDVDKNNSTEIESQENYDKIFKEINRGSVHLPYVNRLRDIFIRYMDIVQVSINEPGAWGGKAKAREWFQSWFQYWYDAGFGEGQLTWPSDIPIGGGGEAFDAVNEAIWSVYGEVNTQYPPKRGGKWGAGPYVRHSILRNKAEKYHESCRFWLNDFDPSMDRSRSSKPFEVTFSCDGDAPERDRPETWYPIIDDLYQSRAWRRSPKWANGWAVNPDGCTVRWEYCSDIPFPAYAETLRGIADRIMSHGIDMVNYQRLPVYVPPAPDPVPGPTPTPDPVSRVKTWSYLLRGDVLEFWRRGNVWDRAGAISLVGGLAVWGLIAIF